MPENYLEQLVSEWFEYQGYFVRRNIPVSKREKGGYETELDIVGFNPQMNHLVHIEPSMDADSWSERDNRYGRKFELGREYIPEIFKGFDIPKDVDQIAILVFASKQNRDTVGGGRIVLIKELLKEIFQHLISKDISSSVIPEHLPILRSFQFVTQYRNMISEIWREEG